MSATESKRSVIVGIFVLIGLAILVAGIFIMGGLQKRFVKSIQVQAVFDDVEGLQVGNNIQFSGVKIGTVKSIRFFEESQVQITMNIEESARSYIHKDAKARISSESLIGNRIIVIEGGSPRMPSIEDGDRIQVAVALSTDEMMETLQENNRNLVDITRDFKVLSAGLVQGRGTMGALLQDSLLATNFNSIVKSLQQASATTVRASAALAQFSSKLNSRNGLANRLLTDTAVFNRLDASVTQLKQTTTAAAAMTENLNQASTKLNNKDNALGLLINDAGFANRLQNTMGNLESSTDKLDENMEALQHNILFRGYFKKQDKKEQKEAAAATDSTGR